MPTSNTHTITVKASTKHLSEVRDAVADYAKKIGVPPSEIEQIRLAVDEAYTNIIKHAYKYDDSKMVEIRMGSNGNEFWVSLLDNGKSFDPSSYTNPDIKRKIQQKERGGVGVFLMKKMMDRIEYRKRGKKNEIKMVKKVPVD